LLTLHSCKIDIIVETNKSTSSRGIKIKQGDTPEPVLYHCKSCTKLSSFDWVEDTPKTLQEFDIIEVQFKNTRKAFFRNANQLHLKKGDIIAVEASPGHDIGVVSLTGWLVMRQLKKLNVDPNSTELKKVYRKAKPVDTEKWLEAINLEHITMIKARGIAENLKLNMKIGDVEYQGDKTKAIFYYIADERVDFRELIKILAEEFKIRVEMRQIGARQEAGRIGGIGSCGRELCCSTWVTNFVSVTTNSARVQEISLNPQKLAGQCSKLKCCLNYELDCYVDARKDFPETNIPLETKEATFYHFKTDIFNRTMWFSSSPDAAVNVTPVPVDRVIEIAAINKKGLKVDRLVEIRQESLVETVPLGYHGVIEEGSLTRFDEHSQHKKKKKKHKFRKPDNNAQS
jgi:cell fate regulator YaaT (PSP1 superfamily)